MVHARVVAAAVGSQYLNQLVRQARSQRYRDELFPAQRSLFDDPAKTKIGCCSRRAGKTWVASAALYEACCKGAGSINAYLALTAKNARFVLWPILKQFNERFQLGLKMNEHEMIAMHDNGAQIVLAGADDIRKVEHLRGVKGNRFIVDEAQAYPKLLLRYLIEDVLDAATLDMDGDIWLIGTPNAACTGHFYDLIHGTKPDVAKVSSHHWTVLDNPFIPHAEAWLARKRAERKWTEDNPTYRREYLGQWVKDLSAMVFRFNRAIHMLADLPAADRRVVGVDLGISQKEPTTAVVLVGWAKHDNRVVVRQARKSVRTNADELGDRVAALAPEIVVVDEGVDLGYGYEWQRRRTALYVKAAKKREKRAYVEHLNTELDAKRCMFGPDTMPLVEELELLQWDEERKGYDARFADHCADAMLYAWRECWPWLERPAPKDKTEVERMQEYKSDVLKKAEDKHAKEAKSAMRRGDLGKLMGR